MNYFKRISSFVLAGFICFTSTVAVKAESNDEKLNNMQQQLQNNNNDIQQKEKEKQAVMKDIEGIQKELSDLNNTIAKNKEEQDAIQRKIDETHKQIEQKMKEIISLEEKVLMRKDIMKKRMVSVQDNSNINLVVEVIVDSKNIAELLQRMTAVSTIMDADKEILRLQEQDLRQIEADKKVIDEKERSLEGDKQKLAKVQADLQDNLKKRQDNLQSVQAKYNQIASQLTLAAQEKAKIEADMKSVQDTIAREQQAAAEREKALKDSQASQAPQASQVSQAPKDEGKTPEKPTKGGREIFVEATAYTNDPSENGKQPGEHVYSAWGHYDLTANPNMKLIAVDPRVIPLGSRVWVQNYGEAIAADTGGAIKGYRIDVFVPDKGASSSWGRRQVRVIILD
ncbi:MULTISPECIES: 3D domain-containing protein [unclassified Bacillus (in: firmicutes)]|uniref:3D domain-containing protein n=1 Tax=unclassified Bacillus (in: firmicutes) TaxID=185979 RepID=UPI0008E72CF6|nr:MULTISPECIES: 3D domain-containing protein [unclassified Bacillus (in: firmicutes)]SFJ88929.1 3D (Asp-Asp-Asp) domain-containing protein [Bacillus sp. 71mf]SFT07097.1 3D (Asp-Asp-Asp) domain-containing protein [Bacillus sp. 103mf]